MHYRRTHNGIIALGLMFSLMFLVVIGKYYILVSDRKYTVAAAQKGTITIKVETGEGYIFDRYMKPLPVTGRKG